MHQEDVNRTVYSSRGVYRLYTSRALTAAERACLAKYDEQICGRDVLDVGVGTGRTARYLASRARRYEAIDYSPVMIAYLRRKMPDLRVHQLDVSNMQLLGNASFDFVFAPNNVIDVLSHERRMRAFGELSRVLRPGGVLAFSCHNLRYKRAYSGPALDWSKNPVRLAKNFVAYLLSSWNHVRVRRMRQTMGDYAVLNDPGHFYGCLHYYTTHAVVRRHLAEHGFALIEAFDTYGKPVTEMDDDSEHSSLLYVARRVGP